MHTTDAASITQSVRELYRTYPFPQLTQEERARHLVFELCKYEFLGLDQAMRGARVLDVGCGTGRHMLLHKHCGVRHYVGLDSSPASLAFARRTAEQDDFPNFTPVMADLFKIPFPDETFDVVLSWGVLHHTPDPFRGLTEMARVCRRGGYVALFVYNKWNHWRFNRQKSRVFRLAGEDLEDRFRVAHRLYGSRPVEQMTPGELVIFYDRYCHPYKSDHTFGEVLGWFDRLGLEYWGSSRPCRFRDFLRYLQSLARRAEAGTHTGGPVLARKALRAAQLVAKIPGLGPPRIPFKRPTALHRFVWQAALAWQGRSGRASHSTSFCARKP